VALTKLVTHPLQVALACFLMQPPGAPLAPFMAMALVPAAALPSASNVAVLAERYGAHNRRVARIILASTVQSFGSFSLLAWGYGVRPASLRFGLSQPRARPRAWSCRAQCCKGRWRLLQPRAMQALA